MYIHYVHMYINLYLPLFAYHTKSTFSRPISATPAADPMTRRDPPVPAQKAINCHSGESIGSVATYTYINVMYISIHLYV
jgi:hypothetical protein